MAKSNEILALEQKVFNGLACEWYPVEALEDALSQGLDVNATFKYEDDEVNLITACIIANRIECVKALLPYKPDIEKKVGQLNVKDMTPLMATVLFNGGNMTEFLIKAGAKVSPKNADGNTALDLSWESGNCDLILLLETALEKEEQQKQGAFNLRAQKQKENIQKVLGRKTLKPRRRPTSNGKGA